MFVTLSVEISLPSASVMSMLQTCVVRPACTTVALPYTMPSFGDMPTWLPVTFRPHIFFVLSKLSSILLPHPASVSAKASDAPP